MNLATAESMLAWSLFIQTSTDSVPGRMEAILTFSPSAERMKPISFKLSFMSSNLAMFSKSFLRWGWTAKMLLFPSARIKRSSSLDRKKNLLNSTHFPSKKFSRAFWISSMSLLCLVKLTNRLSLECLLIAAIEVIVEKKQGLSWNFFILDFQS